MADIDVVKGRSNTWMWWVIAAVAVALVMMFLMRRNDRDTQAPVRSPTSSSAPVQTPTFHVA